MHVVFKHTYATCCIVTCIELQQAPIPQHMSSCRGLTSLWNTGAFSVQCLQVSSEASASASAAKACQVTREFAYYCFGQSLAARKLPPDKDPATPRAHSVPLVYRQVCWAETVFSRPPSATSAFGLTAKMTSQPSRISTTPLSRKRE